MRKEMYFLSEDTIMTLRITLAYNNITSTLTDVCRYFLLLILRHFNNHRLTFLKNKS